jgi:hypothetical protein
MLDLDKGILRFAMSEAAITSNQQGRHPPKAVLSPAG